MSSWALSPSWNYPHEGTSNTFGCIQWSHIFIHSPHTHHVFFLQIQLFQSRIISFNFLNNHFLQHFSFAWIPNWLLFLTIFWLTKTINPVKLGAGIKARFALDWRAMATGLFSQIHQIDSKKNLTIPVDYAKNCRQEVEQKTFGHEILFLNKITNFS